MSRFYEISVSPSPSSVGKTGKTWTSYPGGQNDPGALNVELDLLWGTASAQMGNSTVSIDGIPLEDLFQANVYSGMTIAISGGMKKGLPLANPKQAGLLMQGIIIQGFGNWVGTDMNLNFVLNPLQFSLARPSNIVFNWQKGQPIQQAITNALGTAYKNPKIRFNLTYQYATTIQAQKTASNLDEFRQFLQSRTALGGLPGINLAMLPNGSFVAWDKAIESNPIQVEFTDLVGQPKWVDVNTLQFTTVMRGDITIGSYVKMPPGLPSSPGAVTTGPNTNPLGRLNYNLTFKGPFIIVQCRHIGNFRDADGTAWVTIFLAQPAAV
jgi:hypothetical protein